jgi:hypothetical protein
MRFKGKSSELRCGRMRHHTESVHVAINNDRYLTDLRGKRQPGIKR